MRHPRRSSVCWHAVHPTNTRSPTKPAALARKELKPPDSASSPGRGYAKDDSSSRPTGHMAAESSNPLPVRTVLLSRLRTSYLSTTARNGPNRTASASSTWWKIQDERPNFARSLGETEHHLQILTAIAIQPEVELVDLATDGEVPVVVVDLQGAPILFGHSVNQLATPRYRSSIAPTCGDSPCQSSANAPSLDTPNDPQCYDQSVGTSCLKRVRNNRSTASGRYEN